MEGCKDAAKVSARDNKRWVVIATVIAGLSLGAFAIPAGATTPASSHARAQAAAKHRTHKLTRAQKARERRRLTRMLRKNPRLALSKAFLRKASFVDYSMPLTVRLSHAYTGESPDDRLQIQWNTDTQAWPLGTTSYAPSVQQARRLI